MPWFPRLPEGVGRLRRFNTLLVALITGGLLAQRFFRQAPEVVNQLEVAITVCGVLLGAGLVAQYVINWREKKTDKPE